MVTTVAAERAPFRLLLIKPSKYDDDGYVMRHWRGVLPSNTLAALHSLTLDAERDGALGEGVSVEITMLDETAQRVDPRRLMARLGRGGARVAVGLVGVQTNQFPRAADLARQFRDLGATVLIGGFHVSGAIEMFHAIPPEVQALMDDGVTVVKGEVEEAWGGILRDVYEGRPKLFYDIVEKPDLGRASIPEASGKYMKRFVYPNMGTIDMGRGCPFSCSFCTIINVQGRKMRNRAPEAVAAHVRTKKAQGMDYYFFTDDNFARNKNWEEIFDALIALREEEGIEITFMMQVDTLAYRIENFCDKARRAGCTQVFIGLEAIRSSNLDAAGKRQNKAVDYREMTQAWRAEGIAIHTGYIIGFPDDTPELVAQDIETLKNDLHIDQASFFMLTPLPGSEDHVKLVKAGARLDSDYNKYDSFHAVMDHPKMTRDEWYRTYLDAWGRFYTREHMRASLLRAGARTYWSLFKNYLWYKVAILETTHPMICGLFRLKDRLQRRPGFAVQGRWAHLKMRTRETARTFLQWAKLYYEMQEIWLQTRPRRGRFAVYWGEWMAGLESWRARAAAEGRRLHGSAGTAMASLRDGAHERMAHWQEGARSGRERLEKGARDLSALGHELIEHGAKAPGRFVRAWDRMNFCSTKAVFTRQSLNEYWRGTLTKLRRGRVFAINPFRLALNAFRDVKLSTAFTAHLLLRRG